MLYLSSQLGNGGVFDVRAFKAKGDGSTDDRAAIQAAMDAAGTYAASNGGATLYFPPAKYKMSTTAIQLKGGVTIYAYGAYIFSGTSNVTLFQTTGGAAYGDGTCDDITLLGGVYDAKGQSAATDAGYSLFSIFNCKRFTARDVSLRNVASWHAFDVSSVDTATIVNCRFEGFVDKTSGQTRQYSESVQIDNDNEDDTPTVNVLVQGCYMGPAVDGSGNGSFGCLVGSHTDAVGAPYSKIRVIGNTIVTPISTGVRARSWNDSVIADNIITGGASGFGAIHAANGVNNLSYRLAITGNTLSGYSGSGICVSGTTSRTYESCTITGNICHSASAADPHIKIAGTNHSTISGNTMREGTSDGIELGSTSTHNVVSNNQIYDVDLVGIQIDSGTGNSVSTNKIYAPGTRGIWLSNTTTKNSIQGNHITGAGRATNATYGAIEVSNTANNDNHIIGNIINKFGSGNEALTPILLSGSTPTGNHVVGNSFEGWSASYASNFTLNGATIVDDISSAVEANTASA